ncbi:efflux RND transporter periplasmic adaptor subunit [Zoogloea sp.]|uniref:efflux RND transporter periplasmic adaptor subunit n=1 Tax=Zoogloea sp. TaxID=49181 RepID=UPI002C3B73E5|nr:efflux RND transporter periplasmic adaptor subunit [Zoogloea sp.]HNB64578.1 efflux RND transporter periplasmic adaptor subunit [Rhodocyclaceae bacterium]HNH16070.1 efflux RND transporter periplasmic adaptor subunit [Zoogloea sp.]
MLRPLRYLPHGIAAACALIAACAALAAEPLVLQPVQLKALGIETAVAAEAAAGRGARLPARVSVPNAQLRVVSAPVEGLVESLAVAPGSTVRKGQEVARLASRAALELQRDALQADSQAALLKHSLSRDETLFREGLIPESRLQATRAAAAQAGAQAAERRQALGLAGAAAGTLGSALILTAPLDGVVLEQSVQTGQRVEPAAPIFRIARLSPLWLEIQAPLEVAAGLREGAPVRLADGALRGRLIAIGRAVDATSQTVLLRAEVGAGAERLRPGQVVDVELDAPAGGPRRLPAAAVVRHEGASLVFVQTGSDAHGTRFEPRPVKIVAEGGEGLGVDGVAATERVVVKGASGLKALLAGVGRE